MTTKMKVKIDGVERMINLCEVHATSVLDRATEAVGMGESSADCEICTQDPIVSHACLVRYFDRTDLFLPDGTFAGTLATEAAYQDESRVEIGRAAIRKARASSVVKYAFLKIPAEQRSTTGESPIRNMQMIKMMRLLITEFGENKPVPREEIAKFLQENKSSFTRMRRAWDVFTFYLKHLIDEGCVEKVEEWK